jgi:putative transposase
MNKQWYSAAQLAAMKLPGLPGSEPGVRGRAQSENWTSRQVSCKGGKNGLRTEYQPPKAVLMLISEQRVTQEIAEIDATVEAKLPAAKSVTNGELALPGSTAPLNDKQKSCELARTKIVNFIREYAGSAEKAISFLNTEYTNGNLNSILRLAYENAWDKKRADSQITLSTYNKWVKCFKTSGSYAPLRVHPLSRWAFSASRGV